jgi:hypothetical protein
MRAVIMLHGWEAARRNCGLILEYAYEAEICDICSRNMEYPVESYSFETFMSCDSSYTAR